MQKMQSKEKTQPLINNGAAEFTAAPSPIR